MYIFGPVPSRRLGLSLGIDLLKGKTCNLNCIYCECGRTLNLTNKREIFVETEDVLKEIKDFFYNNGYADYITFSGSGEPTLALNLGDVIDGIKKITKTKIAVLTNGILLYDKDVREDLKKTDVVIPSLDAVSEITFKKLNRPHKSINIKKVIEGLKLFAKEYKGEILLEIMIVKNFNDNKEEILKIKEVIDDIPEIKKVQINTVVRSRAEIFAEPVPKNVLEDIKQILGEKAEIIGEYKGDKILTLNNTKDLIKEAILRRPMSKDDLLNVFKIKEVELNKYLDILQREGIITKEIFNKKELYRKK